MRSRRGGGSLPEEGWLRSRRGGGSLPEEGWREATGWWEPVLCIRSDDIVHLVPPPNDGLRDVVLVAQRTEARRAKHEVLTCSGFKPEPSGGEHTQKVTA